MIKAIERSIDPQGRIMLPKEWRKFGNKVLLIQKDQELRIIPAKYKKLSDIPEKIVDITSNLNDWHSLKNELLKSK
ncbi:hypothetical protein HYV79_02290 [Candidatus Woesearchaeota archaeon]|nr:hypothetical protein [Candidatus Woesearchaeota archaeon]